jgi:hypothetical protein
LTCSDLNGCLTYYGSEILETRWTKYSSELLGSDTPSGWFDQNSIEFMTYFGGCNSNYMTFLGIINPAKTSIAKTFTNLPPHYGLKFDVQLILLTNWNGA